MISPNKIYTLNFNFYFKGYFVYFYYLERDDVKPQYTSLHISVELEGLQNYDSY